MPLYACFSTTLTVLFSANSEYPDLANLNHVADTVRKQRSVSMSDFEIIHESSTNTWHVVGAGIQRFVQMTNWQYVLFISFCIYIYIARLILSTLIFLLVH